jgi:hypothetical protein
VEALHKLLQVTREEKKEKDLFDDDEAQKVFLQVSSSVEVKAVIQFITGSDQRKLCGRVSDPDPHGSALI